MVDCKSIGHDVPTLGYDDPANEGAEEHHRGHPPAGGVGGPPVQHQLVGLQKNKEMGTYFKMMINSPVPVF
jgi:hypothetical protein